MKTCSACHRLFPDDGGFCPVDGQKLVPTADAPRPKDFEDPRVGQTICGGRYEIWRKVADGGMGRVYQALDTREERSVALKILHADVAMQEVAVERFKREFECSRALPHDYIVEVLAFERTEDKSYALVMEYLEGEELRTLLKREKRLPPERVIRMVAEVAVGLQSAHDRQVVHRDMKPDNIFLCGRPEGDLSKILDFGSVRDNSAGAKKLTVLGTTIGSPFYMAPEQAQALPSLDHRADVWSMAAIAYECLAGTVPFRGNNGPAILLAILSNDPQPPSELGCPATFDAVIESALAKNPDIRTPTIGKLADDLGHAYGLTGDHHEWATVPQDELGRRIAEGLPAALAKHAAEAAQRADTAAMDAAFKNDDRFAAGSEGGPAAFGEDMVMGVPKGPPKWIFAALGAVVLLGILGAIVAMR